MVDGDDAQGISPSGGTAYRSDCERRSIMINSGRKLNRYHYLPELSEAIKSSSSSKGSGDPG